MSTAITIPLVPAVPAESQTGAMSIGRRRFVAGLILLIVAAHGAAIVCKADWWPVYYYGMFSRPSGDKLERLVVFGLMADGSELELIGKQYWGPLESPGSGLTQIQRATKGAKKQTHRNKRTNEALGQLWKLYETRRQAGLHAGPPLVELRVYEESRRMTPTLANIQQPDSRRLVFTHDQLR